MRIRLATLGVASPILILLAQAAPVQAAPTLLNVRIEGQSETLFEGPILTEGHEVEASSDTQERPCDGTNNGAHRTPGPTPTAASVDAIGLIGETFDGKWYPGYDDYFITRWGPDEQSATEGAYWGILVNNVFTSVGGCQYELGAGNEVLWVYNAFSDRPFLALFPVAAGYTSGARPLTATAELGKPFEVEVARLQRSARRQTYGQSRTHGLLTVRRRRCLPRADIRRGVRAGRDRRSGNGQNQRAGQGDHHLHHTGLAQDQGHRPERRGRRRRGPLQPPRRVRVGARRKRLRGTTSRRSGAHSTAHRGSSRASGRSPTSRRRSQAGSAPRYYGKQRNQTRRPGPTTTASYPSHYALGPNDDTLRWGSAYGADPQYCQAADNRKGTQPGRVAFTCTNGAPHTVACDAGARRSRLHVQSPSAIPDLDGVVVEHAVTTLLHRRTLPGIFVLCALALLCTDPAALAKPNGPTNEARLDSTVRYLQDSQLPGGGFGNAGQEPSQDFSAWVAFALAAAGINPRDQAQPGGVDAYSFLVAHFKQGIAEELCAPAICTTTLERELLVVETTGTDPHDFAGYDLLGEILARKLPGGSFPYVPGDDGEINDTVWAMLALSAIGEPAAREAVHEAAKWLIGQQESNGSWSWKDKDGQGEVDTTGAAIEALNAAGMHDTAAQERAFKYLHEAQEPDGGFPEFPGEGEANVASTAWATQGIWSAGQNPEAWLTHSGLATEEPLGYMASLQQPDGHIEWGVNKEMNGVWMTAMVAPTFAGGYFPYAEVPYVEPSTPGSPGDEAGSTPPSPGSAEPGLGG